MSEKIEYGPERRRGDQRSRVGQGTSKIVGGDVYTQPSRKNRTPNELASWKLYQSLEKYPIFTIEARQDLQNEFVEMASLRTMNMKVFAATLAFLAAIKKPTPENFKDEIIIPHLALLLPATEIDENERRRLITRFKAQILIYIQAIEIFRTT